MTFLLPGSWGEWTAKLLPGERRLGDRDPGLVHPERARPWVGFAVFAGEVAVLLVVAHLAFRRRDA
jgi:ABC-2 type transport system permease protein